MEDINNRLRNGAQDYAYEHGLSFFNAREHRGLLRNMMIRLSNTGELMVLMQFCFVPFDALSAEQLKEQALAMLHWMHEEFPEVSSLLWVNNEKFNDTIGDLDVQLFSGTDHIFLEMEGLKFKVGPKSFYQTNTEQAYILYKVAREFAGLTGNELVYDLYTGTGTIANFVANKARKVIGIEYVPEAIEDAKVNSKINSIANPTPSLPTRHVPECIRTSSTPSSLPTLSASSMSAAILQHKHETCNCLTWLTK